MRPALLALVLCVACSSCAQAPSRTMAPGQLGINLNGPADWNTELPFVDMSRFMRPWVSQQEGKPWGQGPKLDLDAQGWVRSLAPGCFAESVIYAVDRHHPGGDHHVYFQGDGDITFNRPHEVISRESGHLVVKIDPNAPIFMQLRRVNPSKPLRDIRMVMPGFEKTWKTQVFRPGFMDIWRGVRTLRFMDWQETNATHQVKWADRPQVGDMTWAGRGIPVEVMCDLSNRMGADPWFCMPHAADDDYIRQFAMLVKAKLDPKLKVVIEYSNEVWNGQFEQNRYAGQQGQKLGLAEKPWEAAWYYTARRSVEIFKLWEEVFGGTTRLVRVLPSQAANPWVSEQIVKYGNAYKHADALAIAPYFGMMPSPGSNPSSDTLSRWSLDQLFAELENKVVPEVTKWVAENKAVADKYRLKLIAYEGGQHLVGTQGGENNSALEDLFKRANRDPRMGQLYTRNLEMWQKSGGGLFAAFSSVGQWSKWGSWGAMEFYDDDPAKSPKYQALKKWGGLRGD